MKVLYLAPPSRGPHGLTAHSFIDEELRGLAAAGVRPLVLTDNGRCFNSPDGIPSLSLSRRRPAHAACALRLFLRRAADPGLGRWRAARERFHACRIECAARILIRREGVQLVHSHFGWPDGLGGLEAARACGTPVVASFRGMDLLVDDDLGHGLRREPAYDAAVRRLARGATLTVYASEFMRRAGIAAGAPPERALLVRKGVDLERFAPAGDRQVLKRSLGVAAPLLLAVGHLKPLKGLDLLLDAVSSLRDLRWTLIVCGEGPDRARLAARVQTMGLANRVRFAGQVSRAAIPRYFAAADLFVHAARLEAAGNVILEALASGCPVVCTDAGGPAEYVVHGQTGLTVPTGHAGALSGALRELLLDSARRRRMSAEARRLCQERYAWRRHTQDLISVYQEAIRRSAPSRPPHAADRGRRQTG